MTNLVCLLCRHLYLNLAPHLHDFDVVRATGESETASIVVLFYPATKSGGLKMYTCF